MAESCIPKQAAEKLQTLFKSKKLTGETLQKLTPDARRKLFGSALDPEAASHANALFEKARESTQKQAIENYIWKNIYQAPKPYTMLNEKQQLKLRSKFTMDDLKAMPTEKREAAFANIIGKDKAKQLNDRFEKLKKSGNLSQWEARALGTDELMKDKRVKGAFARLEALNELGLLKPEDMETFMEDYVSDELGVSVTAEESEKIADLTSTVSAAFDKADTDWTADNFDNVVDYFVQRKHLEDYLASLDPAGNLEVFAGVTAPGSLLMAVRSLVNSIAYQLSPTIAQAVVKRFATGTQTPGDYGFFRRVAAIIMGRWNLPVMKKKKFGEGHLAMAMQIYQKTGYDISRMESLDDGFRFFGERFTHTQGPSYAESEGIKKKINWLFRGHAKLMTPGFKYLAGGTDAILANLHRFDTTVMLAKNTATLEQSAGKLTGTIEDRVEFLFKDAMRPNPTTDQGAYIRSAGLMDANYASFTNKDIYKDKAEAFRDGIGLKGKSLGKLITPFVGIPATALGKSLEIISGIGVIRGAYQVYDGAYNMEEGTDRQTRVAEGIQNMILSGGGLGAAFLLSMGLDDDDYIAPYDLQSRSDHQLSATEGLSANMVRIGGHWISTKWFGPLGLPLSGFMMAKQAGAQGQSRVVGYLGGLLNGLLEFPGLKETLEWGGYVRKMSRPGAVSDWEDVEKELGKAGKGMLQWGTSRVLTSTGTGDIWPIISSAAGIAKPKYDTLGRKIPERTDSLGAYTRGFFFGSSVRPDTSTPVTEEFRKLSLADALPVLTEPGGKGAKKLQKAVGEEVYNNFLNASKHLYAAKVEQLIKGEVYKKLSPEERKAEIDSIRRNVISDQIKSFAEGLPELGKK